MTCRKTFSDIFLVTLRRLGLPLLAAIVIGCTAESNRLDVFKTGLAAPSGTNAVTEEVDGLLVGHRLMEAREYELALSAYYRAARDQGLTADVLSAVGSATLKLGRLNQAEDFLRLAVERDEAFVPAWNNLGVVLSSRGKLLEAREAFRIARDLDGGETPEIADNFKAIDARIKNIDVPAEEDFNFHLVRRGNGRYLLLGSQ